MEESDMLLDNFILGFNLLISLYLLFEMKKKIQCIREMKICIKTIEIVDETYAKILEWQRVRPFLHINQCPYMQSLVWTMIRALERRKKFAPSFWEPIDETFLAELYVLLSTTPPTKPIGPEEGPFFILSAQYT